MSKFRKEYFSFNIRFDLEKSGASIPNTLSITTNLNRLRRHYRRKAQKPGGYRFGSATVPVPGTHLNLTRPPPKPAWRQVKAEEAPVKENGVKYPPPPKKPEVSTICNTVEAEINTTKPVNSNNTPRPKPFRYEEACTAFNVPSVDGRKSACPSEGRRYAAVIGELSKTISKVQAHDTKDDGDSMYTMSAEDGYTDDSSYDSNPLTYENIGTQVAPSRTECTSPTQINEKLKAFAENELEKIDEQIHILLHGLHGNTEGIESSV